MQAARQAGPATVHHTQRPPQSTGGPGLPVRAAPRAAATRSRWPGLPPRRTGSAVRPHPSAKRRKRHDGGAIPAPPAGRALPGNTGRSHCRARPRLAWAVPQAAATRRAQKAGSCQGNAQKGWRERDDGHGRRGNQSSVWRHCSSTRSCPAQGCSKSPQRQKKTPAIAEIAGAKRPVRREERRTGPRGTRDKTDKEGALPRAAALWAPWGPSPISSRWGGPCAWAQCRSP